MFYGIEKTTLVDYPGEIAATLFTGGCNMRCPFCHNGELVTNLERIEKIEWEEILAFLRKRKNVLDGVCITGGEPLIYPELKAVIAEIKCLGLKVKLDTNGTYCERLRELDLDYIAMDIKCALEHYERMGYTGDKELVPALKESIDYIIGSGIAHEFRTTVVPGLVTIEDIRALVPHLKGAMRYALAQYRPQKTLDPAFEEVTPYPVTALEEMGEIIRAAGIEFELRANYKNKK